MLGPSRLASTDMKIDLLSSGPTSAPAPARAPPTVPESKQNKEEESREGRRAEERGKMPQILDAVDARAGTSGSPPEREIRRRDTVPTFHDV